MGASRQTRAASIAVAVFLLAGFRVAGAQANAWRATWAASPSAWQSTNQIPASLVPASLRLLAETEIEFTVRDIVHGSAAGERCRLRISNVFGTEPLQITSAHVARQQTGSAIIAGTDRTVAFDGQTSLSIPPGADALSDPIDLRVPADANLAVSLATKGRRSTYPIHFLALQTSYASMGDQAGAAMLHDASDIPSWPFLTEVQVAGPAAASGTVVAFGDSITDGALTTPNTNKRWPNRLYERFAAAGLDLAVTDAGIAGNRLLHDAQGALGSVFGVDALARFDRDVLSQAGARYVIALMGTNDIGQPGSGGVPEDSAVSLAEIEFGLDQLAEHAHERGMRIMIATLGYFSNEKEQKREQLNQWIRSSKAFDGLADFDKALRDPAAPTRLRPDLDGGDHLHPNNAGDQAIADSIPLSFFSHATRVQAEQTSPGHAEAVHAQR
jgi:lysophospholipase L1-like esterase